MLAVARSIVAKEGISGFARGLLPRVMLLAPLSSLTISLYSVVHRAAAAIIEGTPVFIAGKAKGQVEVKAGGGAKNKF